MAYQPVSVVNGPLESEMYYHTEHGAHLLLGSIEY